MTPPPPPSRTLQGAPTPAPAGAWTGPRKRLPLLPFVPFILSALVLLGGLFPLAPVREVVTGAPLPGVSLETGPLYLLFAPLYGTWDRLGLLPLSIHIGFLLTLIGGFLIWRLVRRRSRRGLAARMAVELGMAALSLAALLAFYAAGALLQRPMATLVVEDPELLVIDLHSHTDRSHDGRAGFDPEMRREWNASSGFHAVLVTDHYNWGGYQDGRGANPARAGMGTVLLQGAELKLFGKHTNVMGDSLRYRPFIDDTGRNLRPEILEPAIRSGQVPPPTFLMALPVDLSDFQGYGPDAPLGLIGLEVNDASPKGMEQSMADRELLLQIADSLDLAIFAGSNNHGWGRTAAAWNLMRLPGWRDATPGDLERRVEAELHLQRRGAVTVVERPVPWHGGNDVLLALAGPHVVVHLFRTLNWGERLSWLAWIWIGTGVLLRIRPRSAATPR